MANRRRQLLSIEQSLQSKRRRGNVQAGCKAMNRQLSISGIGPGGMLRPTISAPTVTSPSANQSQSDNQVNGPGQPSPQSPNTNSGRVQGTQIPISKPPQDQTAQVSHGQPTQESQQYPPVSLPETIQEEIAIIRGKKIAPPSPSLKRLEQHILGYPSSNNPQKSNANQPAQHIVSKPAQSKVKSQSCDSGRYDSGSYDSGDAISMSQLSGHMETIVPQAFTASDPWQAENVFRSLAQDAPYNTHHDYDDYGVEAFEAPQDNVKQVSTPDVCHVPGSTDHQQVEPKEKVQQSEKRNSNIDDTLFGQIENKIASKTAPVKDTQQIKTPPVDDTASSPVYEPPSQSVVDSAQKPHDSKALLTDQKSVDLALQELENDLDSILGNDQKPDDPQQAEAMRSADEDADPAAATALYQGVSKELGAAHSDNPHDIFDNMSMSYANTFDAGKVDLSLRFSQFDKEMELQETSQDVASQAMAHPSIAGHSEGKLFVDPSDLDDIDIAQDLAEITFAQSKVGGASAGGAYVGGAIKPVSNMQPTVEHGKKRQEESPVEKQPALDSNDSVYPNVEPSTQPGNSVPTHVIEQYPAGPVTLPPETAIDKDEVNLLKNIEALLDKKLQDNSSKKKQGVVTKEPVDNTLQDDLKRQINDTIKP